MNLKLAELITMIVQMKEYHSPRKDQLSDKGSTGRFRAVSSLAMNSCWILGQRTNKKAYNSFNVQSFNKALRRCSTKLEARTLRYGIVAFSLLSGAFLGWVNDFLFFLHMTYVYVFRFFHKLEVNLESPPILLYKIERLYQLKSKLIISPKEDFKLQCCLIVAYILPGVLCYQIRWWFN